MKRQTFIGGIFLLFVAGIIAKIFGAVYRIPLTWILGAEGLGLYQLVFPIFFLFMVLSTAGMPTAMARIIAQLHQKSDFLGIKKVLRISLITLAIIGMIFGTLLASLAYVLAKFQGYGDFYIGYLAISPAVVLVSMLGGLKGYFQGLKNMLPTAMSQIIEQVGKLVFGLLFSYYLINYGIIYGAFGAVLGVTVSELLAVIVLWIMYKSRRYNQYIGYDHSINISRQMYRKVNEFGYNNAITKNILHHIVIRPISSQNIKSISTREIVHDLLSCAISVVGASIILPMILFVQSVVIVKLLTIANIDNSEAVRLWGINTGVVNSLINMPISLSLAISVSLVPTMASTKDVSSISHNYNQSLFLTLTFCVPMFLIFVLCGENIINILFADSLGGEKYNILARNILMLGSINILLGSITHIQNSMLQGLGYERVTLINMLVAGVVQIGMFVLLVPTPFLNIWGSVISSIVFYAITCGFNSIFIIKKLGIHAMLETYKPIFFGALPMLFVVLNIHFWIYNIMLRLVCQIAFGGIVYLLGFVMFLDKNSAEFLSKFNIKKWLKRRVKANSSNN